jgi:phosphohistidine swiveling domain-containing protein
MTITDDDLGFQQPGKGGWMSLSDHFPGALTAEYQRLYAETCPPGMARYMARYGVLARGLDVAFVHGHLYITPVPLAGPRELRRQPPRAAVWVMSRLHPEFRRRNRAARRALAERPWRATAAHWFESERATWCERNEKMQSIDPASLTANDLIDHLRACRTLASDGYSRHFELHGDDLLPIGLLIARCSEWGVAPATAMRALDGASPLSAGTVPPAPWQMVTGYDLDSRAWIEMARHLPVRSPNSDIAPLDLRPLVPVEHHDELDRLVEDARAAVPLRDDNGAITGAWPMGLLRRAMLEAGRRLQLHPPDLAVEMTTDELIAGLRSDGQKVTFDVARRRADRLRRSQLEAPLRLGPEFAIPPLDALPRSLALMGAAQLAAAEHMSADPAGAVGIGTVSYTGRAVIVSDPTIAMDVIEPGDVIITRCTSPSWNTILAYAGALVTATGGLASHAAVIARELGIPAVIGDSDVLTRFASGVTITVDPVSATVVPVGDLVAPSP